MSKANGRSRVPAGAPAPRVRAAGSVKAPGRPQSAQVFAALGDETRLALLARLSSGRPSSIQSLTEGTDLTRQAITKHLRVLEGAGLVRCRKNGRANDFSLLPQPLERARRYLEEVSAQWDAALIRLKAFAERPE